MPAFLSAASTVFISNMVTVIGPTPPGTGVIAGSGVRAVVEAAGISDILTKSLGSSNVLNVVYATVEALQRLKSPEEEAARRGKPVEDLTPFWGRRKKHG